MPNKSLFRGSNPGPVMPPANTTNAEGAPAYRLSDQEALAVYAATGCLNSTFYSGADEQLDIVLRLARACPPAFVAKTAVFSRQTSALKDMPALLCAYLAALPPEGPANNRRTLFPESVFTRCIDNAKQLRTFLQILRSGKLGRKSLGTRPQAYVQSWFNVRTPAQIWNGQVGDGGMTIRDAIRLGRPKPASEAHAAIYRRLLGKPKDGDDALVPTYILGFEAFRKADPASRAKLPLPEVNFQLLTDLELTDAQWIEMAKHATWQQARQNLNHFGRHGVWNDKATVEVVAALLANPEHVRAAKAFPHQLLMAYLATSSGEVPNAIRNALQDALDVAVSNVPTIPGRVLVGIDVSSSMRAPATGHREGATSKARCVDVAALVAAAVMRKNPEAIIVPFDDKTHVNHDLNPRDSVMTNAAKLAAFGGGGTATSLPLAWVNQKKIAIDAFLLLSDSESWVESARHFYNQQDSTATAQQWAHALSLNPKARMACVNIAPQMAVQVPTSKNTLNVAGWNDSTWPVIAAHFRGETDGAACVKLIEGVEL